MNDPMQQARITEAREYLKASRRNVQLDPEDVVIHRGLNGWVVQMPDAEGWLTERLYEDDTERYGDAAAAMGLLKVMQDYYPDHAARMIAEMARGG